MRVSSGGPKGPAPPTNSGRSPGGPRHTGSFVAVLGERVGIGAASPPPAAAPTRPRAPDPRKPAAAGSPAGPSPIRSLLERTVGAEQRVDTLLAAAARGKTFSPSELLALQTTVFRYSQAVEIVSRATDKLVGAVKQTMGTQV